jgi:hypothetical protein
MPGRKFLSSDPDPPILGQSRSSSCDASQGRCSPLVAVLRTTASHQSVVPPWLVLERMGRCISLQGIRLSKSPTPTAFLEASGLGAWVFAKAFIPVDTHRLSYTARPRPRLNANFSSGSTNLDFCNHLGQAGGSGAFDKCNPRVDPKGWMCRQSNSDARTLLDQCIRYGE